MQNTKIHSLMKAIFKNKCNIVLCLKLELQVKFTYVLGEEIE